MHREEIAKELVLQTLNAKEYFNGKKEFSSLPINLQEDFLLLAQLVIDKVNEAKVEVAEMVNQIIFTGGNDFDNVCDIEKKCDEIINQAKEGAE